MTSLGWESQSQAQSSTSSSATQSTQLAPLEPIAASPILQGGSGRLNGLSTYTIDDEASTLIASRYKPGAGPPTPSKRFERGRSSASRTPAMSPPAASALGAWQVVVGRAAEGTVAWYVGEWEGPSLKKHIERPGVRTLAVLEEKCCAAWKAKQLKVDEIGSDRAVGRITLIIGGEEGEEKPLTLRLDRDDGKALEFATFMSIELCRQSEGRRTALESAKAKLDQTRKLSGVAPPSSQRHKVEASLVNPNRAKRKHVDDGGFEGDDEEEEEQQGGQQQQQQQQQKPASAAEWGTQGRGNGKAAKKAIDGDETEEEEEEMLGISKWA